MLIDKLDKIDINKFREIFVYETNSTKEADSIYLDYTYPK
jgi:hypothetical protein